MIVRAFTGLAAFAVLSLGGAAFAATPASFDILPNTSLIKFESEAPLENITGISTKPSGSLSLDTARPASVRGTISVPVKSLRTGNTTRDGHLQSDQWLDAAAHPNISFEIVSVHLSSDAALTAGSSLKGTATGKLSIKGTTKTIEVPIKVQYIASNETLRRAYITGDVLRVLSRFDVTLADFGVTPPDHLAGVKVSDTVSVRVSVTAVKQ